MIALARLIFESCPFGPEWSALLAGFAVIGPDGQMYLTPMGEIYLESVWCTNPRSSPHAAGIVTAWNDIGVRAKCSCRS
jgi:hypothetical protein